MKDYTVLRLTNSREHEYQILESYFRSKAVDGVPLQILEAGCGQKWDINLDGIQYCLTGVDLDQNALEIRRNQKNDLHEIIVGDLYSVELSKNYYDIIYCSYVLEHIREAEQVIKNFVSWLKPGGIVIIKVPDKHSVHGFVTHFSPHWFHVFYYKYIFGMKNAGKPGFPPYPVQYTAVITRSGMRDFCNRNDIAVLDEYGDGYIRQGKGIIKNMIHYFKLLVDAVSFGRISSKHSNLMYVIQK